MARTTRSEFAREVLAARLDEVVDKLAQKNAKVTSVIPPMWEELVEDAAKSRGLAMDAYIRRAFMAFVVHDLNLDWKDVMQDEPRIYEWDEYEALHQRGQGYGDWHVGD